MTTTPGIADRPAGQQAEDGWPVLAGTHYFDCLERLHRIVAPDWYLEIGTDQGGSLVLSECRSIAIDPEFRLAGPVWENKPSLHMFRDTSDAVFASGEIERLGARIDLAFIDGMHLFEYVLRDFINVERIMSPKGVIVLHDVVPIGAAASSREWDRSKTLSWTGDVWKMVEILRRWRPDLTVDVLDARPSGLAVIRGLDPGSRRLEECREEIVEDYLPQELDPRRRDGYMQTLGLQSARAHLDTWEATA